MQKKTNNSKRISAYSTRMANLPPFIVSGGPFAQSQQMGWHIVNNKGHTVAVSPDSTFAESINDLFELVCLLNKIDTLHHLEERRGDGYLSCSDDVFIKIRLLLKDFS